MTAAPTTHDPSPSARTAGVTVPGRPLLFIALVVAMILLVGVVFPQIIFLALTVDAMLIGLLYWDGARLAHNPVSVQRSEWTRVQIDRPCDVLFRIENRGQRAVIVGLRQPWPSTLEADTDRLETLVEPGEVVVAALRVTPRRRGRIEIPTAEADVRFPLGLAKRRWDLNDAAQVTVYPNLEGLNQYDTLRRSHTLAQLGIHRTRIVGSGREFEQLRDYIPDDNYSDINWKATARHRRPITNVYQAERSQDILLCLDCGRMMGNPVGKGTALDRAIDASIMLAHVAHRQGDRVGMALFRDAVTQFIKPGSDMVLLNRIIRALVDAHPEGVFPSYAALAQAIRTNQKRRCLVFLFTDLNDPQLAANLAEVMPLLAHRHVVVIVSLRDPLLDRVAGAAAHHRHAMYQILAANQLATERDAAIQSLALAGVQVLESDADRLSVELVNRYLSIKARQLI